jgi:integrase
MTIINGKKRGRPGRWILDYRDETGRRRWITCDTKTEAEEARDRVRASCKGRGPFRPMVDPKTTVTQLAERWLAAERVAREKVQTVRRYEIALRHHILPALGAREVRSLTPYDVRRFLEQRRGGRLSKASCLLLLAVLGRLVERAMETERLLVVNPCAGARKALALGTKQKTEAPKAFTAEQLAHVLETARTVDPAHAPLFSLLARTGVRIGEGCALRWDDVDWRAGQITVAGTVTRMGTVNTPKNGEERVVDMSDALATELRQLQVQRKAEALQRGWGTVPARIFCTRRGKLYPLTEAARRFKRVLERAGLPGHFSLHTFRHTWASLNLAAGVSLEYVSRTLGHRDSRITVTIYGRHLPHGDRAVANRFDAAVADASTAARKRRAGAG